MRYRKQISCLIVLLGVLIAATAYVVNAGRLNLKNNKTTASQNGSTNSSSKKPASKNDDKTTADISIPVLEYQAINTHNVSADSFRSQMSYLKNINYNPITIDDLYNYIVNSKKLPEKPVLITIDNGYSSTSREAYSILKEFGFKATVFVSTDFIDHSDYLTSAMIKDMMNNNISIQSNSPNRNTFTSLKGDALKNALSASKSRLEAVTGKSADYLAYPIGFKADSSSDIVKQSGFKMAFNASGAMADKGDNLFSIDRIPITNSDNFDSFKEKLSSPKNKQ